MQTFWRNPFRPGSNGIDDGAARTDDDFQDSDGGRRWLTPFSRRGAMVAGLLLLVVLAFGCWLAIEAFQAKSDLEQARGAAQEARQALLEGNSTDTKQWVDNARSHAESAHDATHSLPWSVASVAPWLGSPFKTGQEISDVVLGLATDVLQPTADVAQALSPDSLLRTAGLMCNCFATPHLG